VINLVLSTTKDKEIVVFDKKQRRAYNTIITGLKLAQRENKTVRFLTLNTSDVQKNSMCYDEFKLNDDFRKLKQRVKRMTPLKMIKEGYIKSSELRKYYNGIKIGAALDFEYFKVQTNEGNGVLHIVYKGQYLPYNYLVDNWQDIHNSWNVNIKRIGNNKNDTGRASSYIVSQYVSSQNSTYVRSSQSWRWLFRGYRKRFLEFLALNMKDWRKQYKDHNIYGDFWNAPYKEDINFKDIIDRWQNEVYRIVHPAPKQVVLNCSC
jgi:hypothetical protein